jgi:hypothetical protein
MDAAPEPKARLPESMMHGQSGFGPLFGAAVGGSAGLHAAAEPATLLATQGFCVLQPTALAQLAGMHPDACAAAATLWNELPPDMYLKDGGRYRSRRHASFVQNLQPIDGQQALVQAPHRPHYQPTTYNALHGGMLRWYAPLDAQLTALPCWTVLLATLGRLFAGLRPVPQWFIEAHQFRIDTCDGVGRPTPEGAHRDGVDFVAVILVQRQGIRGGETRVFELDGPRGVRFTLEQAWSVLLMDDTSVVHESTPILPVDAAQVGWRDTLVLTYRAGGFMDPPPGV